MSIPNQRAKPPAHGSTRSSTVHRFPTRPSNNNGIKVDAATKTNGVLSSVVPGSIAMQPTESVKSNPAAMELPISHKAILDIQKFAPAPSQTLYQLVVLPKSTLPLSANVESTAYHKWGSSPSVGMSSLTALEHSKNKDIALAATSAPCYGRVVLRDWPRRRMSQSWSRNGMLNPSEKVLSYKEFLDGDLKDELIHIFGQEQYQNIVQTVQGLANTDSK